MADPDEGKAQWVRLADILIVGPYMIYAASEIRSPWFRRGLTLLGLATIVYNGAHWWRLRETHGLLGLSSNSRCGCQPRSNPYRTNRATLPRP